MDWNTASDAYVCSECFEDEDLRAVVEAYAEESEACSFCGEQSEAVARCKFIDLMSHVRECIERDYDLAANNLGWDGQEGGWLGAQYWDTPDLLREQLGIDLPRDYNNALFGAMCSYLEYTDWCRRNPYGESRLERLQFDWDEFTHLSKHHTRFFLGQYRRAHDPVRISERASPKSFLQEIGGAAARLSLFSTISVSTSLHRARFQNGGPPLTSPADLAPPPYDGAFVSNRMSPPGVVMFYGALDKDTALGETCTREGDCSVGQFRTLQDLRVLDLTRLPEPPGVFEMDPDTREWNRQEATFFREFVRDLTKPIARDERVHLEYVPTQIVVEYFRRQYHVDSGDNPLQGVLYPSSRKRSGVAVVLFCDRSFVVGVEADEDTFLAHEKSPKWIELVSAESIGIAACTLASFAAAEDVEDES